MARAPSLRLMNPREVLLREMAQLGCSINDMTDGQIRQFVMKLGIHLKSTGFTVEQIRYVLREFNPSSDN